MERWLFGASAAAALAVSPSVPAQTPVVWVPSSSLIRISPTAKPGNATTVRIHAARGETQSFQVAIHARDGDLTHVSLRMTDLAGCTEKGRSGEVIPKANLILYREKYMTVLEHSPTWNGPPNLPISNIDTFPDALIPFIDPSTGEPPMGGRYSAAPVDVAAGHNVVFWVDVAVPASARAGEYAGHYIVTSDEGSFRGSILLHVWNFTMPREPALKSSFNGGGTYVPGLHEELLRNELMPDYTKPASQPGLVSRYGRFATDLQFWDGIYYGYCTPTAPPSLAAVEQAKAAQAPGLYLYDDSADPESSCTDEGFYKSVIAWAQVLHKAGIPNLVTQQPVAQLYDDGLGKGRSAVDIWTMLPLNYDVAQAENPPAVSYVLKKGDSAWSYNDLVQDSYSPKWELDFLPINYRIQPGFISGSLGLTGLLYWSVDDWSSDPWENPQGSQNPDYPGEGVLIYPGGPAGLKGVAPSMRLKYLRDGVQDYGYIEIMKSCGHAELALRESRRVARDWSHWTSAAFLLESVRVTLGDTIEALGCSR